MKTEKSLLSFLKRDLLKLQNLSTFDGSTLASQKILEL